MLRFMTSCRSVGETNSSKSRWDQTLPASTVLHILAVAREEEEKRSQPACGFVRMLTTAC